MTQKPMLRVEVGALGAHQVKNIRGVAGQARMCKAPVWVDVLASTLGACETKTSPLIKRQTGKEQKTNLSRKNINLRVL